MSFPSSIELLKTAELHWMLLVILICTSVYYYIVRPWTYFQRHGIPFDRGVPPFGSNYRRIFKSESLVDMLRRLYYQYPNERFIGMYEIGGRASYLIRDPELAKDITTTHFDHFVNRIPEYDRKTDALYAHGLTNLKGDAWRRMRSLLTPLYTSSKFRAIMIPSMVASKEHLVQFITQQLNNGSVEIDMMDLTTRTAIDSFCRSALGIETDVLENQRNEFKAVTDVILEHMNGMSYLASYIVSRYPQLMKIVFGVTALNQKAGQFVQRVLLDVASERQRNHTQRLDVLGLVVNVKNAAESEDKESSKLANYSQIDMIAQCLEFFEATFTENNALLNYIAHTLADLPDVQQRLRNEMVRVNRDLRGETLSNESLRDMKYMDMVLSEALRMCPITTELGRRATKPYTLVNTNGSSIQVQPGEAIWIPSFVMQNDPQYFPNSHVFDPERFGDGHKDGVMTGTYAPFGLGPRDCIGCRYTVLEVKVTFFYLLRNFELLKANVDNGTHLVLKQWME